MVEEVSTDDMRSVSAPRSLVRQASSAAMQQANSPNAQKSFLFVSVGIGMVVPLWAISIWKTNPLTCYDVACTCDTSISSDFKWYGIFGILSGALSTAANLKKLQGPGAGTGRADPATGCLMCLNCVVGIVPLIYYIKANLDVWRAPKFRANARVAPRADWLPRWASRWASWCAGPRSRKRTRPPRRTS